MSTDKRIPKETLMDMYRVMVTIRNLKMKPSNLQKEI